MNETVNTKTGELADDYRANLQHIEQRIAEHDERIADLKQSLKLAKESREQALSELRSAVRDGEVLPLLETDDEEA